MAGDDPLSDRTAARNAVPEFGRAWPDAALLQLGLAVQEVYPELRAWAPYLAAEAHLWHFRGPLLSEPRLIGPRDEAFLLALRAKIEPLRNAYP